MTDHECVQFLRWALPRLGMRWPGFRKVRRQVCKRIQSRIADLGLATLESYREYLEQNPLEWEALDRLCRITISHFYRDRAVFERLQQDVLPAIAQRVRRDSSRSTIRAWSAGCASGEEPSTLSVLWRLCLARSHPDLQLHILATDIDMDMLQRAHRGCYGKSSLKQLPESWLAEAFEINDGQYRFIPPYREGILFAQHDVRQGTPGGPFDLILCRNLVFTYFDGERQCEFAGRMSQEMTDDAVLVIGANETLPPAVQGFAPWPRSRGIYQRVTEA